MTLEAVDRISVTTVVDNSVDILRADEKVARRWTSTQGAADARRSGPSTGSRTGWK